MSQVLCLLGMAGVLLAGYAIVPSVGLGFPELSARAAPLSTPTPTTSAVPPPVCLGCSAPSPRLLPVLYGLVRGRWTSTRTVSLNEALRFVLRVQSGIRGWSHVVVHVRIRRTCIGQHGVREAFPAHIYRVGVAKTGRSGAYTRFAVQVAFHSPAMVGVLFAAFHVSNGKGYIEPGFFFRVVAGGK